MIDETWGQAPETAKPTHTDQSLRGFQFPDKRVPTGNSVARHTAGFHSFVGMRACFEVRPHGSRCACPLC